MTDSLTTYKLTLLEIKQSILVQMENLQKEFNTVDKVKGDESDLAAAHQEEHSFLISQDRLKFQLFEIEKALSRIENGTFGVCEVTYEPIENVRLKAIPWTRYSIEGAEIVEEQLRAPRRKAV